MIEKMTTTFNSLTDVQQVFVLIGIAALWVLVGYITWAIWGIFCGYDDHDTCVFILYLSTGCGFISVIFAIILAVSILVSEITHKIENLIQDIHGPMY